MAFAWRLPARLPSVSIEEVLNACGLSDAFEYVVSGEQFKESKPEPDIYLHALDLLGLPANRCCCVEAFRLPGITAGKRAGLTVIAKREERFGFRPGCRGQDYRPAAGAAHAFFRSAAVARFSGQMSKYPTFWCGSKHTLC